MPEINLMMLKGFQSNSKRFIIRLLDSRAVRRFADSYPKVYFWILERFSLKKFKGLPFTLLFSVFLVNAFLLAEVAENVINSEFLIGIDSKVANYLYHARNPETARFFYYITQLGNEFVVITLTAVFAVVLYLHKKRIEMYGLFVTVVGSSITLLLGKQIFQVNRPIQLAYYPEISYSFPSGHATTATSFYLFLFYVWFRSSKRVSSKIMIFLTAAIIVTLIGFSRIYLCVHYLSDVLGGYALGLGWLLFSISLVEWKRKSNI